MGVRPARPPNPPKAIKKRAFESPEEYEAYQRKVMGSLSPESIQIYELYREKVVHEDTLINFRTSWFVTLQAFLFTSLALSLPKVRDSCDSEIQYIFMLFSLIGMVASITTIISVEAADAAINKAADKWSKPYRDEEGRVLEVGVRDIVDPIGLLPAIKGGGSNEGIAVRGKSSSVVLPGAVGLLWLIMFCYSAVGLNHLS